MQHNLTFTRDDVTLRPLTVDDAPLLRAIVDAQSWAGMSSPLPTTDSAMADHLQSQLDKPSMLPFAVEQAGRLVGRTTFYDLVEGVRVDVGNTIYARDVWATRVNPATKWLLLTYAFDQFQVQRVGLRCDHRNTRSHRGLRPGSGVKDTGVGSASRPASL